MQLSDSCVRNVLVFLNRSLETKKTVSFNDVMAAPECKKFPISDIGKALELLRKNGLVTAKSRFGCSELLEFTAKKKKKKGKEFLS